MLPCYMVANIEVRDAERYEEYRRMVPPTFALFDAGFLFRGGRFEVLEGTVPYDRLVIGKFPSWEHCRNWYHSKEYAPAKAIRQAASRGNMFMFEGFNADISAGPGAGLALFLERIHDEAAHEQYKTAARPTLAAAGGKPLALGGRIERLEGDEPSPTVVLLAFDDFDAAKAWYDSPDYVEAAKLRHASADSTALIAEGL